jgi:hypothetical protein
VNLDELRVVTREYANQKAVSEFSDYIIRCLDMTEVPLAFKVFVLARALNVTFKRMDAIVDEPGMNNLDVKAKNDSKDLALEFAKEGKI